MNIPLLLEVKRFFKANIITLALSITLYLVIR